MLSGRFSENQTVYQYKHLIPAVKNTVGKLIIWVVLQPPRSH